ncbi:substrate-binding periplasmic protein [Leucobacter sp. GX24907]
MKFRSTPISRILALGGVSAIAAAALVGCSSGSDSAANEDCTPAHEFETVTPGELTVASYDYYPATRVVDEHTLEGIEGDLLHEIAERECLTLTVTSSGGAGAVIPSVETGRADLGTGNWLRTKERAKIVHLSAPIWTDEQAVVSTSGITSDDLEGKKVGSVAGNLWNESLQNWLGDDFTVYQDDEAIYGDLKAGRIDALVASAGSAYGRFEDNPIDGAEVIAVTPNPDVPEFEQAGQVMWPSSLDNEGLSAAIDEMIEELRADGTIAETLEKYGLNPEAAETGEPIEL